MLKKYGIKEFGWEQVVLEIDDAEESVASLIKEAIVEKKIERLADAVGLSRPTLTSYCDGTRSPRLNDAIKILRHYGFTLKVEPAQDEKTY